MVIAGERASSTQDGCCGPIIFAFSKIDVVEHPVLSGRAVSFRMHDPVPDNNRREKMVAVVGFGVTAIGEKSGC